MQAGPWQMGDETFNVNERIDETKIESCIDGQSTKVETVRCKVQAVPYNIEGQSRLLIA